VTAPELLIRTKQTKIKALRVALLFVSCTKLVFGVHVTAKSMANSNIPCDCSVNGGATIQFETKIQNMQSQCLQSELTEKQH
jgi:hypothetical protein